MFSSAKSGVKSETRKVKIKKMTVWYKCSYIHRGYIYSKYSTMKGQKHHRSTIQWSALVCVCVCVCVCGSQTRLCFIKTDDSTR